MNLLHEKKFALGWFQVYDDKPTVDIIHSNQTHSDIVLNCSSELESSLKEADGIISSLKILPKKSIGIKTADCLPVLFIGSEEVALVHAGWKGLQNGILKNANILQIAGIHTIYIGPSIHRYEVQSEFKLEFPNSHSFYLEDQKLFFDLQKEATSQLNVNFPDAKVYNSNICTFKNCDYNSYRRDKTTKRNWNIFQFK